MKYGNKDFVTWFTWLFWYQWI